MTDTSLPTCNVKVGDVQYYDKLEPYLSKAWILTIVGSVLAILTMVINQTRYVPPDKSRFTVCLSFLLLLSTLLALVPPTFSAFHKPTNTNCNKMV